MLLSKLFLALTLLSLPKYTVAFSFLQLKHAAIEYATIKQGSRDPFVPTGFENKLDLRLDWWIIKPVYWNNVVHSTTDGTQFRTVSWEFEIGVSPFTWIDFYWQHHSRHLLDFKHPVHAFPVMDAYGFRLNLLR